MTQLSHWDQGFPLGWFSLSQLQAEACPVVPHEDVWTKTQENVILRHSRFAVSFDSTFRNTIANAGSSLFKIFSI
jgi:hypothetical protein